MTNQIIIINGSGGSGKSTFCNLCKKYVEEKYKNSIIIKELSTIDWPKEVATFCGWNGEKTEKDRKFLSDLKVSLEEWDNSPEQKVFNILKTLNEEKTINHIIFVNCREPKNIKSFKEKNQKELHWGFRTLLIKNENIKNIISNIGDASVYFYNYDNIIYNNKDLNSLYIEAKNYIDKIIIKEA